MYVDIFFGDLHGTLQTKPMVFYNGLCAAIVAVYPSLRILEFRWHRLTLDCSFEVPKLHLHVVDSPAANGTAV